MRYLVPQSRITPRYFETGIDNWKSVWRSLIYTKNSVGVKADPCGTELVNIIQSQPRKIIGNLYII